MDNLINGYSPQKVEEEQSLPKRTGMMQLFQKYKKLHPLQLSWDCFTQEENHVDEVLTPREINAFLQVTPHYCDRDYTESTGLFISRLIQNSYKAGHNDFLLDTQTLPQIDNLGCYLKGKYNDRISICVIGDVGNSSATKASYLDLTIQGNASYLLGKFSSHTDITVHGDVGSIFEMVDQCCCFIEGKLNTSHSTIMAFESVFKTNNPDTLQHLLRMVSKKSGHYDEEICKWAPTKNKIVFVHPKGEEEKAYYGNWCD